MTEFVASAESGTVSARDVIRAALTFHLNRLSPGETEDANLFNVCLHALSHVADEINGGKGWLFKDILTAGTVTGAFGTIGTTWAGLAHGDNIMTATHGASAYPLDRLTMQQYALVPDKVTQGTPIAWAFDGYGKVYFYPACASVLVTLHTKEPVGEFADLDTGYYMPRGFRSALSALLAEKLAPTMLGGVTPAIRSAASAARQRLAAQSVEPAIVDTCGGGASVAASLFGV